MCKRTPNDQRKNQGENFREWELVKCTIAQQLKKVIWNDLHPLPSFCNAKNWIPHFLEIAGGGSEGWIRHVYWKDFDRKRVIWSTTSEHYGNGIPMESICLCEILDPPCILTTLWEEASYLIYNIWTLWKWYSNGIYMPVWNSNPVASFPG